MDDAKDEIRIADLDLKEITLDWDTVTLGEMWAMEAASGKDYQSLIAGRMGQKMCALFLHVYRRSGRAPSWSEIGSRRLFDGSSSTSRSPQDGDPPKSND